MEILNDGRVILDPTTDDAARSVLFAYTHMEDNTENLTEHLNTLKFKGRFATYDNDEKSFTVFQNTSSGVPHYNLGTLNGWEPRVLIFKTIKDEKG